MLKLYLYYIYFNLLHIVFKMMHFVLLEIFFFFCSHSYSSLSMSQMKMLVSGNVNVFSGFAR